MSYMVYILQCTITTLIITAEGDCLNSADYFCFIDDDKCLCHYTKGISARDMPSAITITFP